MELVIDSCDEQTLLTNRLPDSSTYVNEPSPIASHSPSLSLSPAYISPSPIALALALCIALALYIALALPPALPLTRNQPSN